MWVEMLCLMLTLAQQCALLWCQLMNRRSDMQMAVELLRHHLSFDKDIKVRHKYGTISCDYGTQLQAQSGLSVRRVRRAVCAG